MNAKANAYLIREDARYLEIAADILHKRGAMKLAEQVRSRVKEWREQADEMERRA